MEVPSRTLPCGSPIWIWARKPSFQNWGWKKLGALKHLSSKLPLKSRKLLANSFIISRLVYLLPIWGGHRIKRPQKIQAVLNNTARFMTGLGKWVSMRVLKHKCSWLLVRELTVFHSLLMMWKTVNLSIPRHIYEKIRINDEILITTSAPRLQNTMKSYRWHTIEV